MAINAQDENAPTYTGIDCTLPINANDANFYGRLIDCTLPVITILVDAIEGITAIGIELEIVSVNTDTDVLTITSDIATETKVTFSTTDALPSPLVAGTIYYVINVDGTHIQVATSLVNSIAGIAIDLIDEGTGTHTSVVYKPADGMMQSLRMYVNINNAGDVAAYLVGAITINHTKNAISTFSLSLNNPDYSPLNSPHIRDSNCLYINSIVNGSNKRLFTGYIDTVNVDYTKDNFRVNVNGRCSCKQLLDKRMSLISVQDLAGKYRGSMIEYIALQANVLAHCARGSYTRIDHSFHDQTALDMMTKEMAIDSMWWRSKEEGDMEVKLSSWPTAHWAYDEDRIIRLGLKTDSRGIINRVKVCGHTYETRTEVEAEDSPVIEYETPITGGDTPEPEAEVLLTIYETFAEDEDITGLFNQGISIDGRYIRLSMMKDWGYRDNHSGEYHHYYTFRFDVSGYKITNVEYRTAGDIRLLGAPTAGNIETMFWMLRRRTKIILSPGDEKDCAGGMSFTIRGYNLDYQPAPTPEEYDDAPTSAIVDNVEVAKPTYEYSYETVNAEVTDNSSIAIFGERKPNSEGTIDFPLAENKDQCEGIAKHIIRESHRGRFQPDFEVPFNPLLKVGDKLTISEKKVGLSGAWLIEDITHNISIDSDGSIKARTQLGCVYFA